MKQLTVKGVDDELSAILNRLAKREGISLNQAARLTGTARNGNAALGMREEGAP